MNSKIAKPHEQAIRDRAKRLGYRLSKSRSNKSLDNFGEYMLLDERQNVVVMGHRYDASLEQIEGYLKAEA